MSFFFYPCSGRTCSCFWRRKFYIDFEFVFHDHLNCFPRDWCFLLCSQNTLFHSHQFNYLPDRNKYPRKTIHFQLTTPLMLFFTLVNLLWYIFFFVNSTARCFITIYFRTLSLYSFLMMTLILCVISNLYFFCNYINLYCTNKALTTVKFGASYWLFRWDYGIMTRNVMQLRLRI